jgi:Ca2+-binding RTX toxin-like protein
MAPFKLNGTKGSDAFILNAFAAVRLDTGDGDDIVSVAVATGHDIRLGDGNDTLTARDARSATTPDRVSGGKGSDEFEFRLAGSFFHGDAGNDTFRVTGVFFVPATLDGSAIDGGSGRDTLELGQLSVTSQQVNVSLERQDFQLSPGDLAIRFTSIESIRGTRVQDVVTGNGSGNLLDGLGGDDFLSGGDGDDQLIGGLDNDTLSGNDGADRLSGGVGNDTLVGGGGADRIAGGFGDDFMEGGGGRDVFIFSDLLDADPAGTIADFARGEDRLDLSAIDADLSKDRGQGFRFIGSSDFSEGGGEIRLEEGVVVVSIINTDGEIETHILANIGLEQLGRPDFIL